MNLDTNRSLLKKGVDQLKISLSDLEEDQIMRYVDELANWNRVYNLTAVRDPKEMMTRHVLDTLSVFSIVQNYSHKTIADIGTGAGIPGVILAIILKDSQFFLVESIGKKCQFLKHIIRKLNLKNIEVIQDRVEKWENPIIDLIICRAFTQLDNFILLTNHLGNSKSTWLAMKALNTEKEETSLQSNFKIAKKIVVDIPFESVKRQVIVLKSNEELS